MLAGSHTYTAMAESPGWVPSSDMVESWAHSRIFREAEKRRSNFTGTFIDHQETDPTGHVVGQVADEAATL